MTDTFCAQCLSTDGPFSPRPYGKDDAIVMVCARCENEHPRAGHYSYSETTRVIPRTHGHNTKTRR